MREKRRMGEKKTERTLTTKILQLKVGKKMHAGEGNGKWKGIWQKAKRNLPAKVGDVRQKNEE